VERWLVGDKWEKIDHVLTDSECSRKDILDRLNLRQDRVTVVYPGVELDRLRPASSEDQAEVQVKVKEELGLRRPYVLCVAGTDPTKNVGTLVEAFARLPLAHRDAHDLVLVGDCGRREDLRQLVARAGIEKHTIFTGVVTDERLVDLYRQAKLFVFPSRYEGFGLPVLEAMACGCPVVCSSASSLPEVVGDAAILLNPLDVEGFTRTIEQVLGDAELRKDLRQRGLRQAARFTWDRTARETITVYEKIVGAK
jgi:glycosyltransferase involved in cell wall biosynthesis